MATNHAAEQAAILEAVADIFRSVFEDPALELTLDTTQDDVPCWDSMNHITLVVEAECRFDIQFLTAEIEDLRSVGAMVRQIQAKRALMTA
jgi:acyl carrier protein